MGSAEMHRNGEMEKWGQKCQKWGHQKWGQPPFLVIEMGSSLKLVLKWWLTPFCVLKKGITFEKLDKVAFAFSDNEFAEILQKKKQELFISFKNKKPQFPTVFSNKAMAEISGSFLD